MKLPTLQLIYPPECRDKSIPHKARKELKERVFKAYTEVRTQMIMEELTKESDNGR